jgi:hypothetical protein
MLWGMLNANGLIRSRELSLMLKGARLAGSRQCIVAVIVVVVVDLVQASGGRPQTPSGLAGDEGGGGDARSGGRGPRDLTEQAGFEHDVLFQLFEMCQPEQLKL